MPWRGNSYFYTIGILKAVASVYETVYDGLIIAEYRVGNPWSIAEFKADFDVALNAIGRGEWRGLTSYDFNAYKGFSRRQRVVIAWILDITDYELMGRGFTEVRMLRHRAFKDMVRFLNGEI